MIVGTPRGRVRGTGRGCILRPPPVPEDFGTLAIETGARRPAPRHSGEGTLEPDS